MAAVFNMFNEIITCLKKLAPFSVLLFVLIIFCHGRPFCMYYPEKKIYATPSDIDLRYEPVIFRAEDGIKLTGWWIPSNNARGVVLFSHGNAGNISRMLESIKILNKLKLSVLVYDYRGYGESEGEPSEQGTYMDAKAAWFYLINERKISERKIIIFGYSLGGSISAWLAREYTPAILIIEASFTSLAEVANEHYFWFPGKLIFGDTYNTYQNLKDVKCPVLIIHSKDDELTPFSQGKKLFDTANEPKEMIVITGSHNTGFLESKQEYEAGLRAFIYKHLR